MMAKRKKGPGAPTNRGNAGKGRKKGAVNKVTADVRQCVKQLAENLAPEVEDWIRRGARRNPLGAAKVLVGLLEFTIPKLQRVEHVDEDGNPIYVGRVVWQFDDGPPPGADAKPR